MTIYFSNKTKDGFDLDCVRTMGVNVKETDNPIGYFGTGLKFAIATLLRTDHTVKLHLPGRSIEFAKKPKLIRGKEFQIVCMDDEQLAFTIDLGKDWTGWQAYRELHSNCMDEMGKIGRMPREGDDVIWAISAGEKTEESDSIETSFNERSKIFLSSEPAWVPGGDLEIHHGKSKYLYYRGVRVYELPKPTRFTYNFLMPMKLTEDRSLASLYDANYKLATRLPRVEDPAFLTRILDPKFDGAEADLDFSDCYDPSEAFLDELERIREELKENRWSLLNRHRKKEVVREELVLTEAQKEVFEGAKIYLEALRVYLADDEVKFAANLGQNVQGCMENGQIWISEVCLAKGVQWVASTLYEEWIHKHRGFPDASRGMQQYLFDKIFELLHERVSQNDPMKKLGLKG